jgi:hypothetical protein
MVLIAHPKRQVSLKRVRALISARAWQLLQQEMERRYKVEAHKVPVGNIITRLVLQHLPPKRRGRPKKVG